MHAVLCRASTSHVARDSPLYGSLLRVADALRCRDAFAQEMQDSEAEEDVAEMLLCLADAAAQSSDVPDDDEEYVGHKKTAVKPLKSSAPSRDPRPKPYLHQVPTGSPGCSPHVGMPSPPYRRRFLAA